MAISGILNIKTIYLIGLMAVVMLLPWSYNWCANAIVVTSFFGLLTTSVKIKTDRLKNNSNVFIFISLFLLYLIGILYTTEKTEGMGSLEQKIFLIGLPIIVATSSQLSLLQLRLILLFFLFSNLALTFIDIGLVTISIIQGDVGIINNFDIYTQSNFLNSGYGSELWSRFSYIALSNRIIDPTYFSIYLVFSISILFFFETKLYSLLKWIMVFWLSFFVILLASRMGIALLGVLLIATIFLKMSGTNIKKSLISTLVVGLLFCIIYLLPVTRYRMIDEPLSTTHVLPSDPVKWNSTNLRLLEWKSGINGIMVAGPFGTGTGGTWPVLQQYSSRYNLGVFSGAFNVHNQYLETVLEIGVAGFIGLLACYFVPLTKAIQTKNILLLALTVIVCLASLTESILERAHGLIFYTTFAPILMYSNFHDPAA